MLLNKLIPNAPEIEIEQLSSDSRLPMRNAIYFCVSGIKYDGHHFVDEAIANGAIVIIYDKEIKKEKKAIYIKVNNVNNILIKIANIFYEYPLSNMNSYLTSGCYGRSSVNSLIYGFLNTKVKAGYIGQFGIRYENSDLSTSFTTPVMLDSFRFLSKMKSKNIEAVTFEASSSSLSSHKVDFLNPNIFIYTNTYEESSDYKESGNNYYLDIRKYLYSLEDETKVILNCDDKSYLDFKESVLHSISYGTKETDYRIQNIVENNNGVCFEIEYLQEKHHICSKLHSKYNAYNLTAAIAALHESGYSFEELISFFENVKCIDGIYEKIDEDYCVFVDCAYTLDTVSNFIDYGKKIKGNNKVIGIISISYWMDDGLIEGIMKYCDENLDKIILTIDECDNENRYALLSKASEYLCNHKEILVEDREVAIEEGISLMNRNDILLITGKGNENFVVENLQKVPYDTDKKISIKYIQKRRKEENETSEIY